MSPGQGKRGVLTTGLPGKSPMPKFKKSLDYLELETKEFNCSGSKNFQNMNSPISDYLMTKNHQR